MNIHLKDLGQMELFRGIAFDTVPEAIQKAEIITCLPDEVILSPERKNTTLFLILSGELQVFMAREDTRPLRTVYPGSCVGEVSLIEDILPTAWVTAGANGATLIALPHAHLWEMVEKDGRIAKNLMSVVSRRVVDNTELIMLGRIRISELEQSVLKDGLTGVYNRRWFDQALVVHMNRFLRKLVPFSLCILDLDRFKAYNDGYGHLAGDCALSTVGRTLVRNLRPDDFVARYGGEEFAIILSDTRLRDAEPVIQRLMEAVRQLRIQDDAGRNLPGITFSGGLAQARQGESGKDLVQRADAALYQAKDLGRDRLCLA